MHAHTQLYIFLNDYAKQGGKFLSKVGFFFFEFLEWLGHKRGLTFSQISISRALTVISDVNEIQS